MPLRRSEGKESENPFFEGDGSSSNEWGDYVVADDDYEGPPVFNDDQYEEEISSGDVGVNLMVRRSCLTPKAVGDDWLKNNIFQSTCTIFGKDELEMGDDVFVLIRKEVVEGSEIPKAMIPLLEEFSDVFLMSCLMNCYLCVMKRISEKRTKNQAKTDKTEHGMEKHGKAKVKSKSTPKSQSQGQPRQSQQSKSKPKPKKC
ncbi:hypothetical protein Tco_0405792 [Tanacetum coccineum]